MSEELSVATRETTARTCRQLTEPIREALARDGARPDWGPPYSCNARVDAQLEAFSRPLWGLVPLIAGGGTLDWVDRYVAGLTNGTDPMSEEYWGPLQDNDQKCVEAAAIGLALTYAPETFWEPLDAGAKERLVDWLGRINRLELYDNNWRWFRVLVNCGLRRVDATWDPERVRSDIERMDACYHGEGWYTDRPSGPADYYIAWAMHTYGLLIADAMPEADAVGDTERFRRRARAFAPDYAAWFGDDGAGVPYGRSLVYRFAQAAFWGALAVADVEALPWGVIRGLWARNVRWWLDQPIFRPDGTLSLGYCYEAPRMAQSYMSFGSPYWAMKASLPLCCPPEHPFWQADEEPHPGVEEPISVDPAGLVIDRDTGEGRPMIFTAGAGKSTDEYGKFAYASDFGFGVATGNRGLGAAAPDGTLAVSTDGTQYRTRCHTDAVTTTENVLRSTWEPWAGVSITSRLFPAGAWHVRVHRIESERSLTVVEGGFTISEPASPRTAEAEPPGHVETAGRAVARDDPTVSELRDLTETVADLAPGQDRPPRDGTVSMAPPNTNLCHPKAVTPLLQTDIEPGVSTLAAIVGARSQAALPTPPRLETDGDTVIVDAGGRRYSRSIDG